MKKARAVYNGKPKRALKGCNCQWCGKWLEKGVRKPKQLLCCNNDSRDLTACQREYYKQKRADIAKTMPIPDYGVLICDVCLREIKKTAVFQKRCTSDITGELSKCQKEGNQRTKNKNRKELAIVPTKKRLCLKCREDFESRDIHNRICEECTIENDNIGMVSTYKVSLNIDDNSEQDCCY